MTAILTLFFLLLCGHALADYGLQTEFVGKYKFRKNAKELPKEQKLNEIWPWILFFHGLTHGFFVFIFTGILILGIIETIAHIVIDFLKCEGFIDVHQDQWLHVLCKVIYVVLIILGVTQ